MRERMEDAEDARAAAQEDAWDYRNDTKEITP